MRSLPAVASSLPGRDEFDASSCLLAWTWTLRRNLVKSEETSTKAPEPPLPGPHSRVAGRLPAGSGVAAGEGAHRAPEAPAVHQLDRRDSAEATLGHPARMTKKAIATY
jgi:hypothetical protein